MSNQIHPTAIIGPNVKMGENNFIGPYCVITGYTIIGDNNRFEAHCTIGTPPEHKEYYWNEGGSVMIGSGCIFREFITVTAGTKHATLIKDGVVMLRNSYVAHDCVIHDNVTLSANALIGGHSVVFEGANFGLGAVCHQYSVIGAYAMIGMNSTVTKATMVEPGTIYVGSPARFLRANSVGLERAGVSAEELADIYRTWMHFAND